MIAISSQETEIYSQVEGARCWVLSVAERHIVDPAIIVTVGFNTEMRRTITDLERCYTRAGLMHIVGEWLNTVAEYQQIPAGTPCFIPDHSLWYR